MKASFQGCVALVTGAGSGLGRAFCAELAAVHAHVLATDIDLAAAQETAAAFGTMPGTVEARRLDVTDSAAFAETIDHIVRTFGRIDLLINNAGIVAFGRTEALGLDQWRKTLDVNLWGTINGIHAAYPVLVAQKHGHILNISSLAGLLPITGLLPYTASKNAILGLSQALRIEAREHGVGVTVACPGYLTTDLLRHASYAEDRDMIRKEKPQWPGLSVSAKSAARVILRRTAANKAIVVLPLSAKMAWWIQRLSPGLMALAVTFVQRLRARKTAEKAQNNEL